MVTSTKPGLPALPDGESRTYFASTDAVRGLDDPYFLAALHRTADGASPEQWISHLGGFVDAPWLVDHFVGQDRPLTPIDEATAARLLSTVPDLPPATLRMLQEAGPPPPDDYYGDDGGG